MANEIYMNLNTYETISLRLYPEAPTNPDYALYRQEDINHVMYNVFELPACSQKYWKRSYSTPPIIEMNQVEKDAVDEHERLYSAKSKMQILNEIWNNYYEDPEGLNRMIMAINKYPIFAIVLEDNSYNTARMIMQMALAQGDITQDDYNNVDGILPLQE